MTWQEQREVLMGVLQEETSLQRIAKLVGPDALPEGQRLTLFVAEIIKNAFLQQNSFDAVDANCGTPRQRYVIDKLIYILGSAYHLSDKDEARNFFNSMRQKFIDWNYTEFESDAFKKAEAEIDALHSHGGGELGREAALLLKDGDLQ